MAIIMEPMIIYANLCPVCKGDVTLEELERGICRRTRQPLADVRFLKRLHYFCEFFRKATNFEPRSLQRLWAKRILKYESFAAIAPTGVGKTVFGIVASLYFARKKKKSYLILPTVVLLEQVRARTEEFLENLRKNGYDMDIRVLYYHGRLKNKEEFFEALEKDDFEILITTTQFLAKNFEKLKGKLFDFIFVDDVDAILKASKNVDKILMLLGFSEKEILTALRKDVKPRKIKRILMVSTATGRKGERTILFRRLLNFDVGEQRASIRNVEDIAIPTRNIEKVKEILKKFGRGGLIFAQDLKTAEEIYDSLKDEFKVGLVSAVDKKAFNEFKEGKLEILIGVSAPYGALIRGLDLPEIIRYAVFYGIPMFKVGIKDIDSVSPRVLKILCHLFGLSEYINLVEKNADIQNRAREEIKKIFEEGNLREKIKAKDILIEDNYIIFPDVRTYIQGSGRTSRLYVGGITKGASFLFDEERRLEVFRFRARFYDIDFKSLEEVDLEKLIKEIDEDRKKIRKKQEAKELIKPLLFIVESPTKAKQISRFFAKPSVRVIENLAYAYESPINENVTTLIASIGHITDLVTDRGFHGVLSNGTFVPVFTSIKRCRSCGHQFTEERTKCPICESEDIYDSRTQIEILRKLAFECENVVIGTDPDTEGEKIAFDIYWLLKPYAKSIKRAEFHEVVKNSVLNALRNLRDIDLNLVKAQLVRRIEDRWIGFELSKKLKDVFKERNLSAGRAQTPTLGWIIERYYENKEKIKVGIIRDFELEIEGLDKKEAEIEIKVIKEEESSVNPLPPYTTDAMLRDANAYLRLPAKRTMEIAQELFESGLITYHRTDSTRVSDKGLDIARIYLEEDFHARRYASEGAHECIRPTRPIDRQDLERLIEEGVIKLTINLTKWHLALYDLIFRRFMASQCKPVSVIKQYSRIKVDGKELDDERVISAQGRAYELYPYFIRVRKKLESGKYKVNVEIKTYPKKPLFTQADVVSLMKERGIGRPSTYSTIIDKLFRRGYIIERYNKLIPTQKGIRVYRYLAEKFGKFVNEERTRLLEEKMEMVEKGLADYQKVLEEMYREILEVKKVF